MVVLPMLLRVMVLWMIIPLANGGVTYAVEGHGLVDDHPARCVHALTLLRQGQVRLTHLHQIIKYHYIYGS
jgi:hypothetical protein